MFVGGGGGGCPFRETDYGVANFSPSLTCVSRDFNLSLTHTLGPGSFIFSLIKVSVCLTGNDLAGKFG